MTIPLYQYDAIEGAVLPEQPDQNQLQHRHEQHQDVEVDGAPVWKRHNKMRTKSILLVTISLGMLLLLFLGNYQFRQPQEGTMEQDKSLYPRVPLLGKKHSGGKSSSTSTAAKHTIPMPHGVNLGSWLSLEDYFFVGDTGAVEVATPNQNTAAICLPPLHIGQAGAPTWQSETDLLSSLLQTSTSVAHALSVFHAHRKSFITEHDLQVLSEELGIKHVRVPLSWCFTDHDIETELNKKQLDDQDLLHKFTCTDPFYKDDEGTTILWPAIPKSLLAQFLRSCAKFGITASLDLHTYPGATSPGTFSGLWPKPPRFWNHDSPTTPQADFGRQLYRDFIAWVEELDQDAMDGILGISPMNEPAHLAGVFASIPSLDYLPALPESLAQEYLAELNSIYIPNGPHLRVLLWLRDAVEVFRGSQLPQLGKQLHVNIHESLFQEDLLLNNVGDMGGRGNPASHKLVAAWWSKTTHQHERKDWAVLDMHHYHAWSGPCSGAVDGPPSGNYTCGDVPERNAALKRCTEWATRIYRDAVDEMCGKGAKLMSGEFSTSTHHRVRHACNDIDTLQTSYLMQMQAAKQADVDMYYWSYKMPHGGAFRSAWSFKELMYLLGVTNRPDHENFSCGDHIPHAGEVTDDYFST